MNLKDLCKIDLNKARERFRKCRKRWIRKTYWKFYWIVRRLIMNANTRVVTVHWYMDAQNFPIWVLSKKLERQ